MSATRKSLPRRFRGFLRRIFGRPLRVLARTGQVIQILFDVTQVQREQRRHYRRIGEIALKLAREGEIHNLAIHRLIVKIDENERILKRQEKLLYMYQRRGTIRDAMKSYPTPEENPQTT